VLDDGSVPAQDHIHGLHPARGAERGKQCLFMALALQELTIETIIPQTLDSKDPLLDGLQTEKIVVASDPGIKLEGFLLSKAASAMKTSARRVVIVYFQGKLDSGKIRRPLYQR
jgi:hypothetical protein